MRTCIFLGCSDASFLPCFKLKKVEGEGGFLFFVFVSLEQHCFLYHSCRVTVFFFVLGKGKKKSYTGSWSTVLFISIKKITNVWLQILP